VSVPFEAVLTTQVPPPLADAKEFVVPDICTQRTPTDPPVVEETVILQDVVEVEQSRAVVTVQLVPPSAHVHVAHAGLQSRSNISHLIESRAN
jgi:hypothetical protein